MVSNDDLNIIPYYNCREIIVWYNSLLFCIGIVLSFNSIYNMIFLAIKDLLRLENLYISDKIFVSLGKGYRLMREVLFILLLV